MSSRATARAAEPVPPANPDGLDVDLESALLAGLSEEGDELPEEAGASGPEAVPDPSPAREAAAEPEDAARFERLPAEAGEPAAMPPPSNGPEPRSFEDGPPLWFDSDAESDFGPDREPAPEAPGTGIDDLLARLVDDDEDAGAGVDPGVGEAPGEEGPRPDPVPAPYASGVAPSPEGSGFRGADRDRPPAAAERNTGGDPEHVLRAGLDVDSAAADAPFPPFAAEEAFPDADGGDDGRGLGDVVEIGDTLGLGDDPAAVRDPVHEAALALGGPAARDRADLPGGESARGDAAPGGPFDDVDGVSAEAPDLAEAVAEPGTDAAGGGFPTSVIGTDADADSGTDSGFPAAEPAPASPAASSPIIPVTELETPAPFAFATDPESERALREGLSDHPLPQVWPGDLRTAVATLGAGHAPRLLFVDLDETAYPAGAIHELAGVCEVGTAVIAFGSNPTARFSREILLAGVSDYLVKPLTAEAVREAAGAAAGASPGSASAAGASGALPTGWSVGFTGTGGSGSTTLAAATALLAAERGRYVSVLDLDRTFPALAFLLDVEPASGLVELLSTAARASLHPEMVDAMRASRGDRIAVYGYPWSAVPPPPPPAWAVCELIEELQRRSHLVIVDGLDDPATRLSLLAVTDGRVLVVEPTGTGAPAAARLRDRLGPMAAPERAALVVQNHTRAFKAKAGAKALLEAGVEAEPDVVVPFEPTLPAVTDRGWPNDRLPKPIRKPLAALADRVLAGERATAASAAGTAVEAAPALARA